MCLRAAAGNETMATAANFSSQMTAGGTALTLLSDLYLYYKRRQSASFRYIPRVHDFSVEYLLRVFLCN